MFNQANWILLSFLCLVGWGIWPIFGKNALQHFSPLVLFSINSFLYVCFTMILFFFTNAKWEVSKEGLLWATGSSVFGFIGTGMFYWALSRGPTTLVVPLTSLYPLLTVILCISMLHETITLQQGFGVALSMIAIYLITS